MIMKMSHRIKKMADFTAFNNEHQAIASFDYGIVSLVTSSPTKSKIVVRASQITLGIFLVVFALAYAIGEISTLA